MINEGSIYSTCVCVCSVVAPLSVLSHELLAETASCTQNPFIFSMVTPHFLSIDFVSPIVMGFFFLFFFLPISLQMSVTDLLRH